MLLVENASSLVASDFGCGVLTKALEKADPQLQQLLANAILARTDLLSPMAHLRHGHIAVKLALHAADKVHSKAAVLRLMEQKSFLEGERYGRVLYKHLQDVKQDHLKEEAAEDQADEDKENYTIFGSESSDPRNFVPENEALTAAGTLSPTRATTNLQSALVAVSNEVTLENEASQESPVTKLAEQRTLWADLFDEDDGKSLSTSAASESQFGEFGHPNFLPEMEMVDDISSHPRGKGKGKGGKGTRKGNGKGDIDGKGQYGPAGKGDIKGNKGYGKYGYAGDKGKGKGKGPQGGCFECGGSHYARECPRSYGAASPQGAVRSLCSVRAVTEKKAASQQKRSATTPKWIA